MEEKPVGDLKEQGEQEDWSKLTDDLRVEILCRLPEESLIAFKRVSKDWYSLISYACVPKLSPPSPSAPICGVFGPCFTRDPAKTSTIAYHGLFHYRLREEIPDPIGSYLDSLPFTCTTKDLLDCCNGFLLIADKHEPTQYLVCNPATRQTLHVPVNPNHNQNSTLVDCSLLFDPKESLEYKIIWFVHSIGKTTIQLLNVFYSETEEWIEYKLPLDSNVSGIGWLKNSVYLDGVLYKISGGGCLICIDIRSYPNLANLNAWATLKFPDQKHQQSNNYVGSIGASRGHLYYFNRNASDFLIWMLKNGTQWVLEHSISIYSLHNSMAGYYCKLLGDKVWSTIQPCVLLPGSKDILLFETPWFLVTYKFKYKSFDLYDANFRSCATRRLGQSFPYSRSLVVLNSIIHKHQGSSSSFSKF